MPEEDPGFAVMLREAFLQGLDLPPDTDVTALAFGRHPHWDSLGHMSLVTTLEEKFGVALDGDDVGQLDSYAAAVAILSAREEATARRFPTPSESTA